MCFVSVLTSPFDGYPWCDLLLCIHKAFSRATRAISLVVVVAFHLQTIVTKHCFGHGIFLHSCLTLVVVVEIFLLFV